MSPEEEALLLAVRDAPYADAPRLAYADWLLAQAPPRLQGEAIRLAVRTEGKSLATQRGVEQSIAFMEAEDRLLELAAHEDEWKADVLAIADDCTLYRGLVASVTLRAEVFVRRAAELFALAPIVHVALIEARAHLDAVCRLPEARRIRALTLAGNELTDTDLRDLALVTTLPELWYLDLAGNQIGLAGVTSLACSTGFPALTHVVLDGNPGDVHERCGLEEAIVHVWMPPEGEQLEATFGRIPWLHFPQACWKVYPPNPCGPPLV